MWRPAKAAAGSAAASFQGELCLDMWRRGMGDSGPQRCVFCKLALGQKCMWPPHDHYCDSVVGCFCMLTVDRGLPYRACWHVAGMCCGVVCGQERGVVWCVVRNVVWCVVWSGTWCVFGLLLIVCWCVFGLLSWCVFGLLLVACCTAHLTQVRCESITNSMLHSSPHSLPVGEVSFPVYSTL